MNKELIDLGFKVGDKIKCTYSDSPLYIEGNVYKVEDNGGMPSVRGACGLVNGYSADWQKVEEMEYEDKWYLNDGNVDIPEDADKLEKDGSVVAFRKRKVKPFEFGEKLRIKKSLWPNHPGIVSVNPGFDYVDAVYISKYFDPEGVEGIVVYINHGEKSWRCCFTNLDKVERLT